MRILIITDAWHPQVNGVVRTYELILDELKSRGHDIRVIGPADFQRKISMPGYPEIKLAVFPYKQLKDTLRTFKPSSIHIATEGPLGLAARRYCIRNNLPFSTSYHTQFPDYVAQRAAHYGQIFYRPVHILIKSMIRWFHKPSSLILVATPGMNDILQSWNFKNDMHIFSRGVDVNLFCPGPKTLFNDMPRPIALYVGRVAIEKNLDKFLDMDWPGSKVVVGDGPMLESLSRSYRNVFFTGKKTGQELAEHYRSADLFVFPSRTDTFGIVIVEALACGLPVAAYNVTGPKDIITNPVLGSLEDGNLAAAAARAIKIGNVEERISYIRENYTWRQAALQFEEGLKQVIIQEREHG